jgi:hypothetical protein
MTFKQGPQRWGVLLLAITLSASSCDSDEVGMPGASGVAGSSGTHGSGAYAGAEPATGGPGGRESAGEGGLADAGEGGRLASGEAGSAGGGDLAVPGGGSAGSTAVHGAGGEGGSQDVAPEPSPFPDAACDSTGWCWFDPLPQPLFTFSAWASASDDVYAAGETLMHFDGHAWSRIPLSSSPLVLYDISGSSRNDVWIAANSAMLHWDGTAWTNTLSASTGAFAVNVDKAGDVWGLFRDSGGGWSIGHRLSNAWVMRAVPGSNARHLWVAGANDVWVAASQDTVGLGAGGAVYHWDGLNWTTSYTKTTGVAPAAIWGRSSNDIWVAGDSGVLHWDGSSWATSYSSNEELTGIWGDASGHVWVSGMAPYPYGGTPAEKAAPLSRIVSWDGSSWSSTVIEGLPIQSDYPAPPLRALAGSNAQDLWALGGQNLVHFDGARWSVKSASVVQNVQSIVASGSNDLTTFAAPAGLQRWDGSKWTVLTDPGAAQDASGPYGGDSPFGAFAAPNGEIWYPWNPLLHHATLLRHWDGSAWGDSPPQALPFSLQGNPQVAAVFVDPAGEVWVSGRTFTHQINSQIVANWVARWDGTADKVMAVPYVAVGSTPVFATSANNAYLAAGDLLHWDGLSWSVIDAGVGASRQVIGTSANDIWAIGDAGVAHWDGTSWNKAAMQASPSAPIPSHGLPYFTSAPSTILPIAPNKVWLGLGSGGALYYNGVTWSLSATFGLTVQRFASSSAGGTWAEVTGGLIWHP